MGKRKHHSGTVVTAVAISVLIAVILDLITPDLFTLLFFQGWSPRLLFPLGILGIVVAVAMMFYMRMRAKRK
jgi:hypothetical protein